MTKASWAIMREQHFGRIVNVASASGLYGNFGQANYSAAKLGIAGLAFTLSKEGASRNVLTNVVAPLAASQMTDGIVDDALFQLLKPEHVAPFVAYVAVSAVATARGRVRLFGLSVCERGGSSARHYLTDWLYLDGWMHGMLSTAATSATSRARAMATCTKSALGGSRKCAGSALAASSFLATACRSRRSQRRSTVSRCVVATVTACVSVWLCGSMDR